mmetsp:Transcript_131749/g.185879  ORF Transcript_131749/g.185879 Transcript_131749/m.185879 type:complete len:160 (-) Transcript_131749:31-510(-)
MSSQAGALSRIKLSKEFKTALAVFMDALPYWSIMTLDSLPKAPLPTGFVAFVRRPLENRSLPHECNWYWAQSGKKQTARIGSLAVTLRKLTARRHWYSPTRDCPAWKVWVVDIHTAVEDPVWATPAMEPDELAFVWSEKGEGNGKEWRNALPTNVRPEK